MPILYEKQYNEPNFAALPEYAKARKIKNDHDFIIFHQCRHEWIVLKETLHYKANELLIEAYATFVEKNADVKAMLILFEYGTDWKESKKLTTDLGIEDKVLWLPLMNRSQLMMWASIADLGVGELGHSWFSYGSVYEILALKKPFIGNRTESLYIDQHPELYPMVSCTTPEEIEKTFEDFKIRPDYYKAMGNKGYEWFMEFAINKPIKVLVEILEKKKG